MEKLELKDIRIWNKEKIYNIYELYAGFSGDDGEIIITNAPLEKMEEQLRILCKQEKNGEVEENVYRFLEENGYTVHCELCPWIEEEYEELEPHITDRLDWYDYYED